MNKPNIKTLKESAELFGFELGGGSIKAAVKSLSNLFLAIYDEDNMSVCENCHNPAPDKGPDGKDLTSCPYCAVLFNGASSVEYTPPQSTQKSKTRKKPNTPKKPKIIKKKKEPVEHIATPEQKEELQSCVEKINDLRVNIARNAYDIGTELNHISDKALWRGLGYKSFFDYSTGELDFARSSAYKYMMVANNFSRDEVGIIGVKKGELILKASEPHQRKLKNAAMKGKSFTALTAQKNKLEGKQRAVDTSTSAKKSAPTTEKITLLGRVKKGEETTIPWINSQTHEPIEHKDITGRYLVIALTNEVELVIVPTEDNLGIVANFRKIGESLEVIEAQDVDDEEDSEEEAVTNEVFENSDAQEPDSDDDGEDEDEDEEDED